jgi:hypothetical protein
MATPRVAQFCSLLFQQQSHGRQERCMSALLCGSECRAFRLAVLELTLALS